MPPVKRLAQFVSVLLILLSLLMRSAMVNASEKDLFALRNLLQNHHFAQVEAHLAAYNERYLTAHSPARYRDYLWSMETLWKDSDLDQAWLTDALVLWVQQAPQSAYAHAVLGMFYTDKGFAARGSKWASETEDAQFEAMDDWFKQAMMHLPAALAIQEDILFAHEKMLRIIKASGYFKDETILSYMEKIPAKLKDSPGIWLPILQALTPRWGGSYQLMNAVIDKAIPAHLNASEQSAQYVKDTITYDKVKVQRYEKNYAQALKLAEKSIALNTPYAGLYHQAAYAARQLKNYPLCYRYAKIATTMRPQWIEAWSSLAFCATKLEKWSQANTAYTYKLHIKGSNKYDLYRLGESYMYLRDYSKAYPLFKQAVALDSDYQQYTQKFTHYIEVREPQAMALVGSDLYTLIGPVTYQ